MTLERLNNYVRFVVEDQKLLTRDMVNFPEYRDYMDALNSIEPSDVQDITDLCYYSPDESVQEMLRQDETMNPDLYGAIVGYIIDYTHEIIYGYVPNENDYLGGEND